MPFPNNYSVQQESDLDSRNVTYNHSNSNENLTDIPSSEIITILIILYVVTTTLAIAGNSLAILIFTRGKRSKTDLRPFLINLAIADLIMAIFCIPFTFTYEVLSDWIFSAPMCPIVIFLQTVSVTGSVSTNMAIGLDRLVVVMYPLRLKLTTTKYRIIVIIIWIIAIVISAVQLFVARTKFDTESNRNQCEEEWPSNDWSQRYTIFLLIVFYAIPLIILTVTYSIIGCILWRRTVPGNADAVRDQAQLRSKRKVVKMLVTVVVLFALCWLPIHTFFLVLNFNPGLKSDPDVSKSLTTVYFFVHWIAMSSCFVNPIIYGFLNDHFRADLRSTLLKICPFFVKTSRHRKGALKKRRTVDPKKDGPFPGREDFMTKELLSPSKIYSNSRSNGPLNIMDTPEYGKCTSSTLVTSSLHR